VYGKAAPDATSCREDDTDSVFGPVHRQRWIYATGKLLLERVLYAMGAEGELDYTIVRPFNFIGPRIDYLVGPYATGGPRVFPHFMSALLTGGPMRLVNGGHVHRAFLDIADANDAFQLLLDNEEAARHGIFNIGNPHNNVTIREFAELMLQTYETLTGHAAASPLEEMSGEEFYGPGYEDGDRLPPDVSRMQRLGWVPRHDLRSTLARTMQYYLELSASVADTKQHFQRETSLA
jgi:UDP-apiose/xylose synthase